MPIESQPRILYNPTFSYAAFILPGVLGAVVKQITLLGVALAYGGIINPLIAVFATVVTIGVLFVGYLFNFLIA